MLANVVREIYNSREQASQAAAAQIADSIRSALQLQQRTAIVVSGGSTPLQCFQALSRKALDWDRVTIVPSDERWVAASHEDSNEALIRQQLMQHKAAEADLFPLHLPGVEFCQACSRLEMAFSKLSQPFASVLLGMGADGHFASLFPDHIGLQQALDPYHPTRFVPVHTGASPHPRISLSLSALLQAREVLLLFFGEQKLRVFEAAKLENRGYPVSALVHNDQRTIRVLWSP